MTENQQLLVHWITERWSILQKRKAGLPKPWTDDKVLATEYFTNVNREDDKVTKWIRENFIYGGGDEIGENGLAIQCEGNSFIAAMTSARLFNQPSTLEIIWMPYNGDFEFEMWLEHIKESLYELKSQKARIWNGAYIVSTNGKKMDKGDYCVGVIEKTHHTDFSNCSTLAGLHKQLMTVDGLGSFIAAQIIADLKNSKGSPWYNYPDKWEFVAPGPGSLRGLSWFWEKKVTNKTFDTAIREAYQLIELDLPDEILEILDMQNFQNCFCEFDKYMRVRTGIGRSKRHYNGRN